MSFAPKASSPGEVDNLTSLDLVRQGRPRSDSLRPFSCGDLQHFSHLGGLNEAPCMLSAGRPEEEDGYESLLAGVFNRRKEMPSDRQQRRRARSESVSRPHPLVIDKET
jgi:hypothetical protein